MNPVANEIEVRLFRDRDYAHLPELFAMLEPELSSAVVISRIPAMLAQGWRCVGAYNGMDLIGMAGFSKRTHLFSGPVIYIENVAVLPGWRERGVGGRLMEWIENQARASGCLKVTLDVYATNRSAQNFYIHRGYQPRGVHFVRELT